MLLQVRLGMPLPNRVMRTNLLKNWSNNLPEYDHEELNLVVQTNVPLLNLQEKEVKDTIMKAINDSVGQT